MIKFEDGKIEAAPGQIRILRASENLTSEPGWRLVAIVQGEDSSQEQTFENGCTYYTIKYRPIPFLVMRRDPDAALEEAHETLKDFSSRVNQANHELFKATEAQAKAEKELDGLKETLQHKEASRLAAQDSLSKARGQVEKYEETLGKIRKLMGDKWFKDNGVEI